MYVAWRRRSSTTLGRHRGQRERHPRPECLESRQMLDAGISVALLDHNAFPGDRIHAEWFITRELIDRDADSVIEAAEVADLTISIDALGVLANQVTFSPVLGDNAYVDLAGNLRGIAPLAIPIGVAEGLQVSVWMTVEFAGQSVETIAARAAGLEAVATESGSTLSVRSTEIGTTGSVIADPLTRFADYFQDGIHGQDSVAWLNAYVDTLVPDLGNYPIAREYLLERLAHRAVTNDKAARTATGTMHSDPPTQQQLAAALPDILNRAYGAKARFGGSWDPAKPTIVLVHGVMNGTWFHDTGNALRDVTSTANVISFAWGFTTFVNGLQRNVSAILSDANRTVLHASLLPITTTWSEARDNLRAAADLHLLVKLLNRAYGASAANNVNIIAHSQGTIVTMMALMLGNDGDVAPPSVVDDLYYVNNVLFMGANLHYNATAPGNEFDHVAAQIGKVTNLYSKDDVTVTNTVFGVGIGIGPLGAGNDGFYPRRPEKVVDQSVYEYQSSDGLTVVHSPPTLGWLVDRIFNIVNLGPEEKKIGWWDWLVRAQDIEQFVHTHFVAASVVSNAVSPASEQTRVGAVPAQWVAEPTIIVASSPVFDISVGGMQVRAPSVPLPTQPIIPPTLVGATATPSPAFLGEIVRVDIVGAAAAAGRMIVRADAYLDLLPAAPGSN